MTNPMLPIKHQDAFDAGMNKHPEPKRRVAVVTGGAMGIGAQVCESLALAGHQVVVADLDLEGAAATANRLRQAGGQALALEMDVGRPERAAVRCLPSAARLLRRTLERAWQQQQRICCPTIKQWLVGLRRWNRQSCTPSRARPDEQRDKHRGSAAHRPQPPVGRCHRSRHGRK